MPDVQPIALRLPRAMIEVIKLRAKVEGRSFSGQCRELIELGLAQQNSDLTRLVRMLEISRQESQG